MRFASAHKFSTYLMVYCAFFALALGGFVSDIVVLATLGGIIASWKWEPPRIRYDRWSRAWTVFVVLILAYSVFMFLAGRDVLLLGAEFLMILTAVKLFNRKTCKDYLHVYILSFLMLVAGTVLNYEFSYGVFFIGYIVASTWALILFHLRREMEDNFLLKHSDDTSSERVEVSRILNSRRIVGRKFFVGTSMVSLSIFTLASLLFLMIPRIGFGFFFQKKRGGVTLTGFNDGVKLGGHGLIKEDRTVVMRVKVDNKYEGRKAPYIHWRGVAFDQYKDGQWSRSPSEHANVMTTRRDRQRTFHMLYDDFATFGDALERRKAASMRQTIYLEPLGNDVIFGASLPTAFEFSPMSGRKRPRRGLNDEMRLSHSAGIKYTVYSQLDPPSPDKLRTAPSYERRGACDTPEKRGTSCGKFDHDLEIPPELPRNAPTEDGEDIWRLTRRITEGLDNNYDRAKAIERWLRTNLGYTLLMQSPGDREPIDFFLFERKRGHCEYFSSAMAMMLRILDIPSRNVNGFLGGEWNEYDNYIAVRAGDAHSWVEAYFPGQGWVTFDPTPSSDADQLGRGGGGIREKLRRFFDNLRFKWFKWVIEYDLYQQLSIFRALGSKLKGSTSAIKNKLSQLKRWAKRNKPKAVVLGSVILGLFVLLYLWRRRRRRRRGSTVIGARRGRRKRIAALYNAVLHKLAKRGHRRVPSQTPREHAAELTAAGVPGAAALTELTEIYYAAEYGDGEGDRLIARARELSEQIDTAFRQAKRSKRAKPVAESGGDKRASG